MWFLISFALKMVKKMKKIKYCPYFGNIINEFEQARLGCF